MSQCVGCNPSIAALPFDEQKQGCLNRASIASAFPCHYCIMSAAKMQFFSKRAPIEVFDCIRARENITQPGDAE
jgi:hypothetical protein